MTNKLTNRNNNMAKKANKQEIPNKTVVIFKGYTDNADDAPLSDVSAGTELTITGYDSEEDTYNVVTNDKDKIKDALFSDEFDVKEEAKKATKKTAKKAAKKTAKKKAKTKETAEAKKEEVVEEKAVEEKPATAKKVAKKATKKVAKKAAKKTTKSKTKETSEEVEKEEEVVLPFKKTVTVSKTLKEYEDDALSAAYDYAEDIQRSTFVFGGILAYIKRNDLHLQIVGEDEEAYYESGLKGFNSYVEDNLGMKAVKAHFLVRIYETFSQVTTENKIEKVGWTKLRELLPLKDTLTKENADEWLAEAKDKTTAELKESVRATIVDSGEKTHGNTNTSKQTKRTFVFFDDQDNAVQEAIDKAKDAMGDDVSDSQALVHIAQEWLALSSQE